MAARRQHRRAPVYERELYHQIGVLDTRENSRFNQRLVKIDLPDGMPDYIWPNEKPGPALAYVRRVLDERYGSVPV